MIDPNRLIFIHGLEGSSQGVKATLLRGRFPGMLTPDVRGDLDARMATLHAVLGPHTTDWTLIGSSFGGLMAAVFATRQPQRVRRLVLLAPALPWPAFADHPPTPVDVPTVVYHGLRDDVVPLDRTRQLAEQVFTNLHFHVVDDDHGLYTTVHQIDWPALLSA